MENTLSDFKQVNERLNALYQTEAYRTQCDRFQEECKRLEQLCFDFLKNKRKHTTQCKTSVVRKEFASGCRNLHRGFYTPSLLSPHMIHNAKQGKILTRITSRSNPCFEYGFNDENQLVLCKSLEKGKVWQTEYLFYEQNRILGFTLDSYGDLESISEEVYENGQKSHYVYAMFASFLEPQGCNELSYEEYTFDEQNHMTAHWHSFRLPLPLSTYSIVKDFGFDPIKVPIYQHEVYTISSPK